MHASPSISPTRLGQIFPDESLFDFSCHTRLGKNTSLAMLMRSYAAKQPPTSGCRATVLLFLYSTSMTLASLEHNRYLILTLGIPHANQYVQFTALENEPFYNRMIWYFRSVTSWMSGHTLSPYFAHSRQSLLEVGYLVIEHVDEGKMLSQSWKEYQCDQARRANLFQDLSQIILCLAKLPLPRIGSWTMNDHGVLSLTNRPLTFQVHQLDNLQISTDIPRDFTYMSVDPYYLDILACHDNRIRHQPNSIHHQTDGEAQLAALTTMRALLLKFTSRHLTNS